MSLFKKLYNFFFPLLLVWLSFSTVAGCGYHFKRTGDPSTVQYRSLAIPLIESTSSTLGFEGEFTRVIREEFASHIKLPLVSRENASAILTGKIYEIKTEALSYDLMQETVEDKIITYEMTNSRRLIIKLDARLVDGSSGEVIWEDRDMEEKATFVVSADPMSTRYYRRQALKEMARRLAKRLYLKTIERF